MLQKRKNEWSVIHGGCTGGQPSPEYQAYKNAKQRCTNPKNPTYPVYGGRGIEFRFSSFVEFIEHIGKKPSPELSLDRIDVNGHYEIGNVRWASREVQQNNLQHNIYLTIDGITRTVGEWSRISGIRRSAINIRAFVTGWCAKCAVFTPNNGASCSHRTKRISEFPNRTAKSKSFIEQVRTYASQNPSITIGALANVFSCSKAKIRKAIKDGDIPRDRSLIFSDALFKSYSEEGFTPSKDLLERLYIYEQKTQREIATELNISQGKVARYLRRLNIPLRENRRNSRKQLDLY